MMLKRGIILLLCLVATISAQRVDLRARKSKTDMQTNIIEELSTAAEKFSLDLFTKASKAIAGKKNNLMISPFSIWALLLLITEGAAQETKTELLKTLRIENTPQMYLREGFKLIQNSLTVNTSTIEVSTSQALFYNAINPINTEYSRVVANEYQAQLIPTNFLKVSQALSEMTEYITRATRNLIHPALTPDDIKDADLVMISSIFFKGDWKLPFDEASTREEAFFDEDENPIGTCQMMTQAAQFNYAPIAEMQSHVVELPYGKEDRLSMLLIIPKKGTRLNDVIAKLETVGLKKIFDDLKKNEQYNDDGEVELYLPKFISTTSLVMNQILEEMGIIDVFQPDFADLSNLSSKKLYLSRVIHQTKIEVNEEGTIAAAVTSGTFANKASPPRFYLNRPFAYLIVEKETRSLLFCGHVTKPEYKN